MPGWLIPVILADLIVTGLVLWFVFKRRQGTVRTRGILGVDFNALTAYTNEIHPRIGEYVRANWSGIPDQLPVVLGKLLDDLDREARNRSLDLDRDMLKLMMARSLATHRIGSGSDVRQALEHVA